MPDDLDQNSPIALALAQAVKQGVAPLEALRKFRHLSLLTLADQSGVAMGIIVANETGARELTPKEAKHLAVALQVQKCSLRLECRR